MHRLIITEDKDEYKKRARGIHIKAVLIILNMLIVLGAVSFTYMYSVNFKKENIRLQMDTFCMTVESMKAVSESYLYTEKGYVDDWAAYIEHENLTLDEALDYIRTINTKSDRAAHFVDMEDFSARSTEIKNGNDWVHCYINIFNNDTNANKTFISKMEKMLSQEDDNVLTLGKYRIGEVQRTVISVGERVYINNGDGTKKPYLLLRVIPVEYLKNSWAFPTEYLNAEISIITRDGEYVVQSPSMKSLNLLEYIRGYNFQDNYNQMYELEDLLKTTDSGILKYKNYKSEDCYWYYSSFGNDMELEILGYIPCSDIDDVEMNLSIVYIVCTTLLMLSILDGGYILSINRQLHRAAQDAERANKAKTDFLSTVSHDIRTPMNAVIGMTDIAKNHLDDKAYVEDCLNKVSMAGNHLLTLINDILDISKVESGKMAITMHRFSLRETIDEVCTIIKSKADEKNITFTVNIHDILSDGIISDKLRLNQILINLLTNAVKYTEAGGHVELDISQEMIGSDNRRVRLKCIVADDGIGISEEFQKVMYSSFIRARDSRIDKIQGSGLGLTITRQLVLLMGGTIDCVSSLGKGTTFTVCINLETDGGSKDKKARIEEKSDKTGEFSDMRILIAEDNDLNWEIIETLLLENGIHSERAENGKQCIEMLEASSDGYYDVVFMDIQMPVMNGKDAARFIRHNRRKYIKNIPIAAMTADAFEEDIAECKKAGMNEHITKPVDMKRVLGILHEIKNGKNQNN